MNTLTDKQKELLLSNKEDLKHIATSFLTHWCTHNTPPKCTFDSFASQFTVEPELERKPRFVTNGDGEEIFDGDRCYTVQVNTLSFSTWTCTDTTEVLSFLTYFKSKEKAEEYITLNAPRLSVNDVLNIVVDKDFYRDKLISLVKSKQ
ncbi:hypothetical protein UFOVP941_37 [uncultured Caudovirales phage]|uniref:Uncharacterized protein n=1 Tax=uncultured Caudovirales phage TaxID=2100421 RepID=A0A6J5PPM0_9CAUD|nr:hypothetical protein UFOVP941_37 [uncultured Caudovirales phage]CAB4202667.1 hypothetical protein UFOVP1373_32 [uncultured Caudovirales phage]